MSDRQEQTPDTTPDPDEQPSTVPLRHLEAEASEETQAHGEEWNPTKPTQPLTRTTPEPGWSDAIHQAERPLVAAWVTALAGTTPPYPAPPEHDLDGEATRAASRWLTRGPDGRLSPAWPSTRPNA